MIECQVCGYQHFVYQGCGNRNCPICPALKKELWLLKRRTELLPAIPYFHIVYTVPHELNPLFLHYPQTMYNLLFRGVDIAYRKVLQDTYGPVQGGMLAVVHSWGQNLSYHPHIHTIVPGAGLSMDGSRWIKSRSAKWLVDVKELSAALRKAFVRLLIEWWEDQEPVFTGSAAVWNDLGAWRKMVCKVRAKNWVVYAKAPAKGADQVLSYLSRYVHRVAFSESRIVDVTEEKVHFRYKDYRLKDAKDHPIHRQMQLEGMEFIRRFLQHTLVPRFQRIRYYGIWASAARKKLRKAQRLLGGPVKIQAVMWSVRHFLKQILGIDPDVCSACGASAQFKVYQLLPTRKTQPITRFESARSPPPPLIPPVGIGA